MSEVPNRIWAYEDRAFTRRWSEEENGGQEYVLADVAADLIRAASEFIEELKAFGYGQTSEKALPGSYDALVAALDKARE